MTDDCLPMTFNEQMRIEEQSQRDQIGYITDYISKKQPLAIKEVDKFVEGHKKLQESLAGELLEKAAIRHTQRLLLDISMPTRPRRYSSREFKVAFACCFPMQRLLATDAPTKEL